MNRVSLMLLLLLICSVGFNYYLFEQNNQLSSRLDGQTLPTSQSANTKALVAPQNADNNSNTLITQQTSQDNIELKQLIDKASHAFELHQFELAVELFDELTLIDESKAQQLKLSWLEQLRKWLNEQQWPLINQFVEQFLIRFTYDIDVLTLKADSLEKQNKPQEAIDQYIELLSLSFDTTQEEFYGARIRHIANGYITLLTEQKAWQQLLNFSEQVLAQDNQFPPYVLAQGLALIELHDLDYAQDIIEPIADISFYQQQAEDLLDKIDKARLHQTAIALEPVGEHYLVNGRINRTADVRLMIDTGASISMLTKAMFDEIESWTDPDFVRDSLINTAGGTINAPIYRFEQFQINEFVVRNVHFVIIDLDNMQGYNGLLGMNFLKEFKFEIDQQENLLVLSPK